MSRLPLRLAALLAALASSGCMMLPTYVADPGRAHAEVHVAGMYGDPSFCRTGMPGFDLPAADAAGRVPMPSGERVTMADWIYIDLYTVAYSCRPLVSFQPKEGARYVAATGMDGQRCWIELVREDDATRTGLALEPSAAPVPHCNPHRPR